MNNKFSGIIWTNHALERLRERGISQSDAYITFNRPDEKKHGTTKNAWVCTRRVGNQIIEVVTCQNAKKEWVIMSVWSKPAFGLPSKQSSAVGFVEKIVQKILKKLFGNWQKKFKKS